MIANQMSGSGGDALPWLFKKARHRTAGGRAHVGRPRRHRRLPAAHRRRARDGAAAGALRHDGEWEVENHGIAPDVEVEQDPALMRQGHDPQLERAVQLALDALAKNPPPKLAKPPYPDYGPRLPKLSVP